jgi:ribosomal protein S18 acetylase RimI-like enzyme
MNWRPYDVDRDRERAHEILRDGLERGPVPYTIHPGDWDWWVYHADPRYESRILIAERAIAYAAFDQRLLSVVGADADAAAALGRTVFGDDTWLLGEVSERDEARIDALRRLDFTPTERALPVFVRPTRGVTSARLPEGVVIRPVRGEEEHTARALAARRAFASTMDPAMHDARYLRFMRSPAYVGENDLVAVTRDDLIAGFTIVWPDPQLSLAQHEPVGTDPDFQRRGIARAVIGHALGWLDALGIRTARVITNIDNTAAIACYEACGFERVDTIRDWRAPAT